MDNKNNKLQVSPQKKRQLKVWFNMYTSTISLRVKKTLADFIEWQNAQKKIEF